MESEETTPGKAAARQRRIQEPTPQPFSHRPPKKEKRVLENLNKKCIQSYF